MTDRGTVLPTEPFARAKARLSDLMDEVVHRHQPVVIDRHRGKERALLAEADDLIAIVDQLGIRFEPKATVSDGEFVIHLPELNLIAGGNTFDEAIEELVELIEEYADDFFARLAFYRETDRWQHAPWLLRFALTPADERRDLVAGLPPEEAERAAVARPA